MLFSKVLDRLLLSSLTTYRKGVMMACVAAASSFLAVPATAQVTWQMATEYPQSNISGIGLSTFAKLVSTRTNGYVATVNAFDNVLNISSGDMLRAAQERRSLI